MCSASKIQQNANFPQQQRLFSSHLLLLQSTLHSPHTHFTPMPMPMPMSMFMSMFMLKLVFKKIYFNT